MGSLPTDAAQARRELRREEMSRFGNELEWLASPELIPDDAAEFMSYDQFTNASHWMIDQIEVWSDRVHSQLGYDKIFSKHRLSTEQRIAVAHTIALDARPSYGTGIIAVGKIMEVVPIVATREGITEVDQWAQIARRAKAFGKKLCYDGTMAQALFRDYLEWQKDESGIGHDDPAKVRIDGETGITTVTSFDELLKASKETAAKFLPDEGTQGMCVALQAKITIDGQEVTIFDALWQAYCDYAERAIYPLTDVDPETIPPAESSDPDYRERIAEICVSKLVKAGLRG